MKSRNRNKMEKSSVVKSKSSNSAITTKSDNRSSRTEKKSRSNAEFQRNVMKKRGVYVEKKPTNISIHNAGNMQNKAVAAVKAPPRPKPGQKRFLASVLTILSKSTAGTQFPENEVKTKRKAKRKSENARESPNRESKTKKYRSKVLNDEMFKNLDEQKSLVLQYKNINNSPSNFSETDSMKHRDSYSPRSTFMKSDMVSVMSSEAKGVVQQVLEGLQMKNKDIRIQEPVTQVEKIKKKNETGENDEQLYKFFVDLLETTFSVYNVKAEYDAAPNIESAYSSKVAFEIDESVVKKLDTRKNTVDDDEKHKQSNFYCVKDTDILGGKHVVPEPPKKPKEVPIRPARPKRRMKAQSFVYNAKPNKNILNTSSFEPLLFPKKAISKKAKKKTLINLFKEQLKMTYSDYEEPQTLYDALRVMARNKRKNQKAIRFDIPNTKECVFRRPKIISMKKPKKHMKFDEDPYEKMTKSRSFINRDSFYKPVEKESHHTIEVYGYDYEVNNNINAKSSLSVEKEMLLPHQAMMSEDDFDFDNFESFDRYMNAKGHINMLN